MDHIKLNIIYKDVTGGQHGTPSPAEITIPFDVPILVITPDTLAKAHGNLDLRQLYGFNANVDANAYQTLIIQGFSYASLFRFSNTSPKLDRIKVENIAEFSRINGFDVRRIDIERATTMVVNSNVTDLYYGIETNHAARLGATESIPIRTLQIMNCTVAKAKIFVETNRIEVQNSEIKYFEKSMPCKHLHIWQNSDFHRLKIGANIEKLTLADSVISYLFLGANAVISEFEQRASAIDMLPVLSEKNFKQTTAPIYELIKKHYKTVGKANEYAKYGYLLESLKIKQNASIFTRPFYAFIKWTAGYGYKPLRPILTGIFSILTFGAIYAVPQILFRIPAIAKLDGAPISNTDLLFLSLNLSLESFLGFSSTQVKPITQWASGIISLEALFGLLIFSLIIYTITKRFSD